MAYWNATINQHSFIFVMICGRKEKTTKYAFKYLINNLCIQFSLSLISFKSCQICLLCPRKNGKGMFNFIISKLVFDTCTNWSEIVDVKQNFIFTTYWGEFKGMVIIINLLHISQFPSLHRTSMEQQSSRVNSKTLDFPTTRENTWSSSSILLTCKQIKYLNESIQWL